MAELQKVDLTKGFVGLTWDGEARAIEDAPGPHPAIEGVTVGLADMRRPPPHKGERHPDGDELLVVVAGRIRVTVDGEAPESIEVGPTEWVIEQRFKDGYEPFAAYCEFGAGIIASTPSLMRSA